MNKKITKEEKIEALLESRKRAKERLEKVRERMRKEEEDTEEVWPGHDSTRYHLKMTEYETLLAHLIEIERELRKLDR